MMMMMMKITLWSSIQQLTFALEALLDDAVEHRAAMITKRRYLVAVHREPMWHVDAESIAGDDNLNVNGQGRDETPSDHRTPPNDTHILLVVDMSGTGTLGHHELMAAFVHHQCAHLALVALLAPDAPDELATVRAEGGLLQDGGHELVPVDLVHAATHRTTALVVEAGALLELLRRACLHLGVVGQLDHDVQPAARLEVHLGG